MKTQMSRKPIPNELHQQMVQGVAGTVAIEGIALSGASRHNFDRYASGQADLQQIMSELIAKYQRKK